MTYLEEPEGGQGLDPELGGEGLEVGLSRVKLGKGLTTQGGSS